MPTSDDSSNDNKLNINKDENIKKINSLEELQNLLSFDENMSNIIDNINKEITEVEDEAIAIDSLLDENIELISNEIEEDIEIKEEVRIVEEEELEEEPIEDYVLRDKVIKKESMTKILLQKLKDRYDDLSHRAKVYILVSLAVLSLGVIITVIIMFINLKALAEEDNVYVSQYNTNTNTDYNYMYINKEFEFKGQKLTLEKMSISPENTIFYFEDEINLTGTIVMLIDDKGKYYNLRLSKFSEYNTELYDQTILVFEPLDEGVKSFKLTIYDKVTNQIITYDFKLDEPVHKDDTARYSQKPINVPTAIDGFELIINYIELSSAATELGYTIIWDNEDSNLKVGTQPNKDVISITTSTNSTKPINGNQSMFVFPEYNAIQGTLLFEPIELIDSELYLNIDALYSQYDINKEIPISDLQQDIDEGNNTYSVDNYNIILERMNITNNEYMFVLHGENTQLPYTPNNPYYNRVDVSFDIKLGGYNSDNEYVVYEPTVEKSEYYGTDIAFSTDETLKNPTLIIDNLYIKIPEVVVPINTNLMSTEPTYMVESEEFLKASFNSRLMYKAGEIPKEEITGFSDQELNDLDEKYTPETTDESISLINNGLSYYYGTSILTQYVYEEDIIAIVVDTFITIDKNGNQKMETNTHKVTVTTTDDGEMLIVDDEILT